MTDQPQPLYDQDYVNGLSTTALRDVLLERIRQDKKWGEQNWDPQTYMCILMEEVGEASTEANDARFKLGDREAAMRRFRRDGAVRGCGPGHS